MLENGGAMRRSRRAASLTAQVLWNMQIEDDTSNKISAKPGRKPSTCKEELASLSPISSKRGYKRSVGDDSLAENCYGTANLYGKKNKLESGCSGHIFSISKNTATKKLTASVAPLVKAQPAVPKSVLSSSTTTDSRSHVNPIFLLPVSLQANEGAPQGKHTTEVGGLSLVTVQAPPDLLNCFGINKAIMGSTHTEKKWNTTSAHIPACKPLAFQGLTSNTKTNNFSNTFQRKSSNFQPSFLHSSDPQVEPLNLKMGETKIPSYSCSVVKPTASNKRANSTSSSCQKEREPLRITIKRSSIIEPYKNSTESSFKCAKPQRRKSRTSPVNLKLQRRKSRTSPVDLIQTKQQSGAGATKKRHLKCPSPDYVCSSPDVDDVQRVARHTCSRKQIHLRNKAAPPRNALEYAEFVEMQRHLLAEAKRQQRKKEKAKAKMEAKKTKPKCDLNDEERPITAVDQFKLLTPEQSNNGWKWCGNPYTSLVFSVDSGKYVRRVCYPGMTRVDKRVDTTDVVLVHDSVFLLASGDEELSYVARVSALWEKPKTKEMMMSLVWYYRPEHTEDVKATEPCEDELFASRHQDEISVACVEERCNVQTYSQFCRTQAKARYDGMWRRNDSRRIVPRRPKSFSRKEKPFFRPMLPGETPMSARDTFFCRGLYDVLQKRVRVKLPHPTPLTH